MSAITLEQIDAKKDELVQLIDKFKQQSLTSTITVPAAQIVLQPGERYAGAMLKPDGSVDYHLILLSKIPAEGLNHAAAEAHAKSLGGKLANKREIRLLLAMPDALPTSGWTWLEEVEGSSYAWFCYFHDGIVNYGYRSSEGGAVAVRRFNP